MKTQPFSPALALFLAALAALAALATPGCGNAVLGVQLQLLTKACSGADPSRDPVGDATHLVIRVTGDNLQPITTTAEFKLGAAQVPNVPVGPNRRISVEARRGATGPVRARADSGPFDATGTSDLKLTLFLRVVDAFTPVGDSASAGCSQMTTARAGHAMALLPDGRVLITGGFGFANGQIVPHSDAEIFDPATGRFTQISAARYQRSGHAALPVQVGPNGSGVLVLGGEGPNDSGTGGPVRPLELFAGAGWSIIQPAASSAPREHQAAALDLRTGYALMAGGQSGPDFAGTPTVLNTAAWYDPQSGAVKDSATQLPHGLTDAVAVPRKNQARSGPVQGGIVLVGGRDGTLAPTRQLSGMIWRDTANDFVNDATFTQPGLSQLPTPRYRHVALRLADDTVLTAGGVTAADDVTHDYASATAAVTLVDPGAAAVYDVGPQLAQARADSCAALLEDGSVLVAGGAWRDGSGLHSGRMVDRILPLGHDTQVRPLGGPSASGDWALAQGRHRAACLRLNDGSVLVTGGLQAQGSGAPLVLSGAEIYTPAAPAN